MQEQTGAVITIEETDGVGSIEVSGTNKKCFLDAIRKIKEAGAHSIKFLSSIAAPEGIATIHKEFPDVEIYCGAHDAGLNEDLYITHGVGDAGDRLFGTK